MVRKFLVAFFLGVFLLGCGRSGSNPPAEPAKEGKIDTPKFSNTIEQKITPPAAPQ